MYTNKFLSVFSGIILSPQNLQRVFTISIVYYKMRKKADIFPAWLTSYRSEWRNSAEQRIDSADVQKTCAIALEYKSVPPAVEGGVIRPTIAHMRIQR